MKYIYYYDSFSQKKKTKTILSSFLTKYISTILLEWFSI